MKGVSSCADTRWVWRPSSCVLDPWDSAEFCRLLGRGLCIIGDSINAQLYASVRAILHALPPSEQPATNASWHDSEGLFRWQAGVWGPATHTICGGRSRLSFVRNDLLLLNASGPIRGNLGRYLRQFETECTPSRYDVVLLNTGAHVQPALTERVATTLNYLLGRIEEEEEHQQRQQRPPQEHGQRQQHKAEEEQWADKERKHMSTQTVVWRESVPGHADCALHSTSRPLPSLHAAEEHFRIHPGWV